MSSIGVALVGLDHWYTAFPLAEGIVRNPSTRLVSVYDRDTDHASELAGHFGAERVEQEWQAAVDRPDIDVVVSLASALTNPLICEAAATVGKHLVANKPIARTLPEATRVRSAVLGAGVHLLPAECRQRLGPRNVMLKQWAAGGAAGELCSATMTIWAGLPRQWPGDERPGWFADPEHTVGGAWVDHAIYQIDILRWVLGEEIASMSGTVSKRVHRHLEVEDYGVATAVFAGGLVATLEDTWTAPTGGFQSSSRLVGSKGAVDLNGVTDRQLVIGDNPWGTSWVEAQQPPYHDQSADIDHLVAVIKGEQDPVATVDDAWNNLAACVAFYESARAGRVAQPQRVPK